MSLTMNGRPIIASSPSPLLTTIAVAGHATQVLAGDAAVVLEEVARHFDATVEPIGTLFGWRSLATNTAAGGIGDSNHMSGTALDINGGRHPRYHRGTFTPAQVAAIRRILADLPGVTWGGDYPVREIDEMHFELTGSPSVIASTAAKIRAARTPTPPPAPVPAPPTRPHTTSEAPVLLALSPQGQGSLLLEDGTWCWVTTAADAAALKKAGVPDAGTLSQGTWNGLFPANRRRTAS